MNFKKTLVLPALGLCIIGSLGWKSYQNTSTETFYDNYSAIEHSEETSGLLLMERQTAMLYHKASLHESGLDSAVFRQAYTGYLNLKSQGKARSPIISIADLSLPSKEPRLWIVDVERRKLLMKTYVAHGRGSGSAEATTFSDRNNSNQSSLGFYLTGEVYYGKHGRSLRLDGMDKGFNGNARARAIVLHGAWYVGEHILKKQNRMGVSLGCPAVSDELVDQVIDIVKDRSVLYINGKSTHYQSAYLNEEIAGNALLAMQGEQGPADEEITMQANNAM